MKLGLKLKSIKNEAYHFVIPVREVKVEIKKEQLVFCTSITLDFMLSTTPNDLKKIGDILRSDKVNKDAFKYYMYPKADNVVMALLSDIKFRKVIDYPCIENYLDNNKDFLTAMAEIFVLGTGDDTNNMVDLLNPLYDKLIETIIKEITK